jgi:ankyrin repeat protein
MSRPKVQRNRETSLHSAFSGGHEAVAKLLLEKGADLDARDVYGWTALQWAPPNGRETVAKLLLSKFGNY